MSGFSRHFNNGEMVGDLSQAQSLLAGLHRSAVPDALFIDLSLNKAELIRFTNFLKEKGLMNRVVVLYADSRLDAEKVKYLKKNELVDDIVNLQSSDINYSTKILFLKRLKSRQSGLSVTRNEAFTIREEVKQQSLVKRMIDILLASAAIILLLPVFILIALAIKLESGGPIIYVSPRAGRGFRVFKFYKFRTMVVGADKKIQQLAHLNQYQSSTGAAQFMKISNDPRITKLGRVLRKTSLDEIPQLFNVVIGDMSLVGNRPLPLYEASTLTTNESVERFMAPAGITGLWQIKKRGKEDMSVEERISLDISYARKANVAYDLWIMAKTPTCLFQKSNV
ncbi:MAG: sugar transferase [Chitinophagaceae bacterium]|nr:MAG: sugar transferase [Chitinophagaceae bacterium]